MKAREIMTTDPVCCAPHETVVRAARIMADADCGCVPVVELETRRILGILTDRDLALQVVGRGVDPATTPVSEVMSRGVVCCRPGDDLEDVVGRMRSHQVRRIPVVDEVARVVGIIAQADLALRALPLRGPAAREDLTRTLEAISQPPAGGRRRAWRREMAVANP